MNPQISSISVACLSLIWTNSKDISTLGSKIPTRLHSRGPTLERPRFKTITVIAVESWVLLSAKAAVSQVPRLPPFWQLSSVRLREGESVILCQKSHECCTLMQDIPSYHGRGRGDRSYDLSLSRKYSTVTSDVSSSHLPQFAVRQGSRTHIPGQCSHSSQCLQAPPARP